MAKGTQSAHLRYIPELDGIRGIAVLSVVLLHFHAPFSANMPLGPISSVIKGGWAGVDIFFVLSGYLISSILLATREAENYFSAFYARRALRIFPLYCLALAFYFWLELPLAHRHGLVTNFHESEQIWYWTFSGNWRQGLGYNDGAGVAHFWSLAIEEQFYILFSVVVLWFRGRSLTWICAAMMTISIGLRVFLASQGHLSPLTVRLTHLHLDPLAMGVLLACSSQVRAWANRWAWVLIPVGVAGIYLSLPAGLSITAAGLAATGAIGMACSRPVAWMRWPVLRSLGKYSYALYVIHAFLSAAAANLAKRHQELTFVLLCMVAGPLASYGLAWISWHVFEERFLRLKNRFPYRIAEPEAPEVDRHLISNRRRALRGINRT
jgi:peptidoglycan/LPS O-acetylase OafA/YrhL